MTIIGAIKLSGVVATQTLEGSMKKEDFLQFIKLDLLPKLKKGDVVVMDNLNYHHGVEVK
ncbi:putative transposase [Limnospira platensis NIES-39]|uniref:Transposase n=1 Tax=Limnospira platensis NIES-46 TaxID=1236695 RepID=A0A5M3TB23_LIMPL|nr:putative transposase [Arthrospira platensis NIES-39]BDT16209.1 putative transposase [Arthrospira platensis NIES-39]GCE96853.1 putative transposase [Arthrospira platensis NIES-46]